MSKRQRSDSSVEEAFISEYVDACVNFTTNVKLVDADSKNHKWTENVLIIGAKEQFQGEAIKALSLYSSSADVAEAASRMTNDEKTLSLFANVDGGFKKITLYSVPSKATRNNCCYRPDAIAEAVNAACMGLESKAAAGAKGSSGGHAAEKALDVVALTPAGSEAAVCKAIASGSPHSFSAKDGSGASGRACKSTNSVAIRVVFPLCNAALYGPSGAYSPADLEALMTYIQLCQRLIDTPTNYLDTVVFAEIAEKYAKKMGCDVKVIKGKELQNEGYNGIYSVGKCAQYPPHLVTLHYENKGAAGNSSEKPKNVALVGKGLVYDCGGLALKPADGMCNMKTDMGGAAATFCGFLTMVACLKNGKNAAKRYNERHIQHLSVTLCLAENAIGPNAYRNDDILIMKSGKSIEVKNTDAEGRICLGDGVHFASDAKANFFKADYVLDMATLTGAQGIATGTKHAAIYCNDDEAEGKILQAGRQCGDTCFPVLYCPEYHLPQYRSPCADLRNIMLSRTDAGVSCGGYFVEANLCKEFNGPYIHVDLAYPTFNDRGATGYGVALLAEFFRHI